MFIRRSLYYLSRKILFAWARSHCVSAEVPVKLSPDYIVIYVLEYRSWTNVMALEHECKRLGLPLPLERLPLPYQTWHRCYTIAPRLPFKMWLENKTKRSRMLRGLLEMQRENPQSKVVFVPVSVFWGRPVAKQKGWLRLLFAETWGLASRTRKIFSILFHGRHILVKFNPPIHLAELINDTNADDIIIDELQNRFVQCLNDSRSATLGPDISHRRTLVRDILQSPSSQHAIKRRAEEDGKTQYQASLQARRYLFEIVANCTTVTIRFLQQLLTAFWNKFYSGIEVNYAERLKEISLSHELVYVPCHRSHVDYLLLSYVIHYQGLVIPYIAAGKNLNLPIIGFILRSAGAFFIRRTFKGNELYSVMLFEYVAKLLSMGMPIEYFIEGGRSRTGRLLKPKPGMLAMTIRGFLKHKTRPVAFIPVYIGYEKMIEGKSYVDELSGRKKQKENLFQTIKAVVAIRGEHGSVYANFGEPLFLNDLLDRQFDEWKSWQYQDDLRPEWLKNTVQDCGASIMKRINQAAAVTSTNLVAVSLIGSNTNHLDEADLALLLEQYQKMIKQIYSDFSVSVVNISGSEQINRVIKLKLIKKISHELGDIVYVQEKRLRLLNYYRNNVLHLFALPSILACCFLNRHSQNRKTIDKLIKLAYPIIQDEFCLPWAMEHLDELVEKVLNYFVEQGLLTQHEDVYSKAAAGTEEFSQLEHLSRVILPILELYFMIIVLLLQKAKNNIRVDELITLCQLSSQRIFLLYKKTSPDYFDRSLISNFINIMEKNKYINKDGDRISYNESLLHIDKDARLLLSSQMRSMMLHTKKAI